MNGRPWQYPTCGSYLQWSKDVYSVRAQGKVHTYIEYAFKTLNKFSCPIPWPSVKKAWWGNVLCGCKRMAYPRIRRKTYLPRSRVMDFSCGLDSLRSRRYVASSSGSFDADLERSLSVQGTPERMCVAYLH